MGLLVQRAIVSSSRVARDQHQPASSRAIATLAITGRLWWSSNRALHTIAVCRLRYDPRTRYYATRRTAEGPSKKDILRCLKRFTAREVYHDLTTDLLTP